MGPRSRALTVALPGRSRRTARRARRPRRARPPAPRRVNATPSGVWRAAPSSSVPMSCVVCRPICSIGLVDQQLHHVQLVGGQQRDALRQRQAPPRRARRRARPREASPHSTARAPVERVAGQQQALGALEAEAVDPHRGRRRAPHARGRVADAAVLGADDEVRAQGEVGAAAHAEAVDLRDDRLGRAPQRHVGVDEARIMLRSRRSGPTGASPSASSIDSRAPADVVARAERPPGAAQADRRAPRRRPGRASSAARRSRDQLGRDRVQALGAVERQRRDARRRPRTGRCPPSARSLCCGCMEPSVETPAPGCAATAAGRPTSRCRSTTRASTRSTPRPASAPRSSTSSRRRSCSAWTACTTSRTSASATAASSRSRTAGSG